MSTSPSPSPSPPSLPQNIYLFFCYLLEPPTTSSGWLLRVLFYSLLSFNYLVVTVVQLLAISPGCSISGCWRSGLYGVPTVAFAASAWLSWLGRRNWARRKREARELRLREWADEKEVLVSSGRKGEKSSLESLAG